MSLRVIYRSYGGENGKPRPAFYSKELALQSLLRAAEAAGSEVLFLNDGPIAENVVAMMRPMGEIVNVIDGGMRRSFIAGLQLPLQREWADDDVVYFCEDDYLHVPDALVRLRDAAPCLPADYFALYGRNFQVEGAAGSSATAANECDARPPRGWDSIDPVEKAGTRWVQIFATTSTFGARVRALRKDLSIFKQVGIPHRRMYRDRDMCLAYQGYEPHRWGRLARDLVLLSEGSPRSRVREAVLAPFKAAMNIRSHRRPENRHLLMGAFPNLATHLEDEFMAPGRDWERIAGDTAAWASARRTADSTGSRA